jgi:SpoVK/Ycf46/Vps4 family AAA+-type ATPase
MTAPLLPAPSAPNPAEPAAPRRARKTTAKVLAPYPSALAHLQDELEWVGLQARGLKMRRRLAEPVQEEEGWGRGRDPIDRLPTARLAPELKRIEAEAAALRAQIDARRAANDAAGQALPIDRLCAEHGLDTFERSVLLLAVGPTLRTQCDKLFEMIDEPAHSLSVMVCLRFHTAALEAQVALRSRFTAAGRLRALDLVNVDVGRRATAPEDLLQASIQLTSHGMTALLGDGELSQELAELSDLQEPAATFDQVVLPEADKRQILGVIDGHAGWKAARTAWGIDEVIRYGRGTFILLAGPPGTGKTLTAHAIAARLGRRLLAVDLPAVAARVEYHQILPGLFREARMRGAVLFFDECETLFADRRRGNDLMTMLLTELERYDGIAVMATNLPEQLDPALMRRLLVRVRFEAPDAAARAQIWRKLLPPGLPLAPDVDLERVARSAPLTGGEIKNAVLAATARAYQRAGAETIVQQADLEGAARDQARLVTQSADEPGAPRTPRVTLSDLFVPAATQAAFAELIAVTRHRRRLHEEWRIGGGAPMPVVALLYGPPGTGKTLSAEAIAGSLGRPLITTHAGTIRGKYVGESEQNLAATFARAQREDAVLLIDEADTMLNARGQSRGQHHDDVLTSTLLSLLDQHPGLVILTSNRPGSLDPALARRAGWQLHLDLPDAAARAKIWRACLPETAPLDPRTNLTRLADRYPISGGDIRAVAARAAARALVTDRLIGQDDLEGLLGEQLLRRRPPTGPDGAAAAS